MEQDELRKKYNPEGSDLRNAQLRMLEMLKFVDRICEQNNITYWLEAGTLLGAVRHGGFIPWDEDTDIGMPLEDMLRFKKLMLENNPSNEFTIQCHETDSAYLRSQWIVLRDLKSEYLQDSNFHNSLKYRGLQVDIFPMEKDVPLFLKRFIDEIQFRFITQPTLSQKWFYRVLKPFRVLVWRILNHILIPICRHLKCPNKYYNMAYGVRYYHKRYLSNIYPLKKVLFEGHLFYAPQNCDAYLTDLYGDWNVVPEEENIHLHNVKVRIF